MLQFTETIPLSLYIHLPWCVRKCPYCDFNSHEVGQGKIQEQEYIDALIRDLECELPRIWGRRIISVFIGGGTPSLFSADALERLLCALRALLNIAPGIEITLEANPGTAEAGRFRAYRELGINRLSIGVQSFNNEHLKTLGRIHDSQEAVAAIDMAHAAGFESLNIDLMFGLPGQRIEEAIQDLQQGIEHGPAHISWYQLTIEPNTVFYSSPPTIPDDGQLWAMQQLGQQLLKEQGFRQYEVSAYATPGHQCTHNLNYWQFGDYLGLGAGAHSKITDVTRAEIRRTSRRRIPQSYMENAGTEGVLADVRTLDPQEIILEFMMNTLRLTEGVPPALFLQRTGQSIHVAEKALGEAEEKGLIEWNIQQLRPTEKGCRYLNDLLQLFMPA